jgi:hypothetical protein
VPSGPRRGRGGPCTLRAASLPWGKGGEGGGVTNVQGARPQFFPVPSCMRKVTMRAGAHTRRATPAGASAPGAAAPVAGAPASGPRPFSSNCTLTVTTTGLRMPARASSLTSLVWVAENKPVRRCTTVRFRCVGVGGGGRKARVVEWVGTEGGEGRGETRSGGGSVTLTPASPVRAAPRPSSSHLLWDLGQDLGQGAREPHV